MKSKRECVIDDPLYNKLSAAYTAALEATDTAKAAKARSDVLAKWFKRGVRPGEAVKVDKLNVGEKPSPVSAIVRWYPGAQYLDVKAEVTDSGFSTDAPKDQPWEASSLELFVSPSGMSQEVNQFIVVPKGASGKAEVKAPQAKNPSQIKATWKRTANGYTANVRIPWSVVKGYKAGWKAMPVEAAVNSKAAKGRVQLVSNKLGTPSQTARSYVVLKAK